MENLLFSPLEQFVVLPGRPVLPLWHNINIFLVSNFVLTLFLVVAIFFVSGRLFWNVDLPIFTIPNLLLAMFYGFIITVLRENIVRQGFFFLSYLFLLFSFLLVANLLGMVPYSFALTSHLVVTLFLSFLTFFTAVTIGFQQHGLQFMGLFLPNGAPFALAPFLILIELISFIARLFSLAIRLFANIMSGHTLLKILASFSWVLFAQLFSLVALVPFVVVFIITGLEIVIALLQAYVFTVLSSIYFNEAIILH
jgi:F-type H+-transporting ATPase subunit a